MALPRRASPCCRAAGARVAASPGAARASAWPPGAVRARPVPRPPARRRAGAGAPAGLARRPGPRPGPPATAPLRRRRWRPRRRRRSQPALGVDQPLVGRLDREEPRAAPPRPRRRGGTPWRAAGRRAGSRPAIAPGARPSVRHGSGSASSARMHARRSASLAAIRRAARRPAPARTRRSPRPPSRPCGSSVDGPVVAGQHAQRLAVEDARLGERLDRRRPGAPLVAVAVLDLERDPRRGRRRRHRRGAGQDRRARAAPLIAALADDPARRAPSSATCRAGRASRRPSPGSRASRRGRRVRRRRATSAASPRGHGSRIGEERVGAGDLAQRERVGRDAAAVDRRSGARPASSRTPAPTTRGTATWAGWSSSQYVSGSQPPAGTSSRNTECWPEHMWRTGLGRLAVAGETGRGQRVERHALGAASRAASG